MTSGDGSFVGSTHRGPCARWTLSPLLTGYEVERDTGPSIAAEEGKEAGGLPGRSCLWVIQ